MDMSPVTPGRVNVNSPAKTPENAPRKPLGKSGSGKKTPRNRQARMGSADSADSPMSPINLHLSPLDITPSRSPSQGNLTGNSRKVKDAVVDMQNYWDRWDSSNTRAAGVISNIANSKMAAVYKQDGDEDNGECKSNTSMPREMEGMCTELTTHMESLKKVVSKFNAISVMLCNVSELDEHQLSNQVEELGPLFTTWPTRKFAESASELLKMFERELALKMTIVENVAHCCDRDLMMVYSAAWLQQPYIENRGKMIMESMLQEVNLR